MTEQELMLEVLKIVGLSGVTPTVLLGIGWVAWRKFKSWDEKLTAHVNQPAPIGEKAMIEFEKLGKELKNINARLLTAEQNHLAHLQQHSG